MIRPAFADLLQNQFSKQKFVSLGLDPEFSKLPEHLKTSDEVASLRKFLFEIIGSTGDLVGVFKPNSAFFEAHGSAGFELLKETVFYIHKKFPEVVVIDDAKRADIGNTNNGYVKSIFDEIGADAVTVHPYLGREALEPFLARKDKGIFVLCRTSNPGAGELQDLQLGEKKLYEIIAQRVNDEWNTNDNCGLVVGATYPEEAASIRAFAPTLPFLIPGVGAQGGDLEATIKNGQNSRKQGMIINSSRGIIFASSGSDFASAAGREAQKLHDQILSVL